MAIAAKNADLEPMSRLMMIRESGLFLISSMGTAMDKEQQEERAWRAQYFSDQARRIDEKIADLQKEAARLREIATRLNPTA